MVWRDRVGRHPPRGGAGGGVSGLDQAEVPGAGHRSRVWSKARPSRNPIRQTGAGLRRLLHLATQRSLSFALWYRSGTKARQSDRAFVLIPCLQAFSEWRDPDSNRGHHDFQSYAEAFRYTVNP